MAVVAVAVTVHRYRCCSPMSHGHHSRGSATSTHSSCSEAPGTSLTISASAPFSGPAKLSGATRADSETCLTSRSGLTSVTLQCTRACFPSASTYGVALTRSTAMARLSIRRTSAKMPPGLMSGLLQSQSCSAPLTTVFSVGPTFTLASLGDSTRTTSRFSPARIQRDTSNAKWLKNPSWEPR